ncbi:uncharacterized protein LOC130895157 [Diorhabda carinulata]|uniref:uncharacterized protein LOC130895157 n=1 Tax=Diorhabda carinulata TaxID=1163345 RepID=UPI0025A1F232|nr:uncharacterized protein LOC130895157 [Diorhabda carinulata]
MKPQKKVIITIGSQDQENVKDTRRMFKDLQRDATDKENLIGRSSTKDSLKSQLSKDSSKVEPNKKKISMSDKAVQVGELTITKEDLISDEPSIDYWKQLAETRGQSLNDSLHEIEVLKENISTLKEENRICKEMLEESKQLVEVLQEMLGEQDDTESQENDPNV